MPEPLPIDALLPEIEAALRAGPNLVIQADPGAGKTTRVPAQLLARGLVPAGEIVVAQPRRLAARMAAQRVAEQLGEPVGRTVGYQVRFESRVSDATRIRFVTEGLLVRRLRDDPGLRGVAAVVLDEFHERHVDTDVALALLRRLQRLRRPELRLLVMSATLDAEPVAAFLDASALRSPGRRHPVAIEHRPGRSDRPLESQVAEALRHLGATGLDGSVLVFLPGAREIRRCAEACEGVARGLGLERGVLHGELPAAEQDRAIAAGPRPKLILSTNVAETSITIEGIAAVIDSGLVRRPSHDPWSGLPTLTLAKIARASAEQRAGRAGRTRAGRCVRLYAEHDLQRRPAFDEPELHRLDLAGAMLDLRAHDLRHASELAWLDAPPAAAVEAAEVLLRRLGATDEAGALTEDGRRMLRVPAHPRLARLLVEAQRRGVASWGATAAALLGERPLRRHDPRMGEAASDARAADVLADIELLEAVARDPGEARRRGVDRNAAQRVQRVRRQLADTVERRAPRSEAPEDDLCLALLHAFPDRVARVEVRSGAPDRLVLAGGGEAELSPGSAVHGAELVVAVAAEQRHDPGRRAPRTIVRSAAAIEPEWLLELGDDALVEEIRVRFDPRTERVDAVAQTRYEGLVIDSTPVRGVPPEASALLREAALARGARAFVADPAALDDWLRRVAFAAAHQPELVALGDVEVERVLGTMCEGRTSFAQLREADLLAHLRAELPPVQLAAVERLAPTRITLAGGRSLVVRYELDRPPWVESRLQDFFGSTQGPAVAGGRVPLVLHLLAPNRRAVQVTTDLAGFWERHYPELRRALMRRYPKHGWPEDPRTATPPDPGGRRRRR
ncbi:MAG: ATP-dependent helicase HrpB [Myxococcales bacterium]|nr:ATP-dependent helicase HrpB [Myxococcales bacterium]